VCDDLDGDGVTCADPTNPDPSDWPFCDIERAVVFGNDPVLDSDDTVASFEVMAKNICQFKLSYFSTDGTPLNAGATPLTGGFLAGVQRVKVTINAKARSSKGPQQYNDVTMSSDILLRSAKYQICKKDRF